MQLPRRGTGGSALTLAAILAALATPPIPLGADEAQDLLNAAQAELNAGNLEQAKALYHQTIEKFPDKVHAGYALWGLAKIHMSNREDDECLAKLNRVLDEFANPHLRGEAASTKLSLLAHRLRDYAAAIQFAEEWLAAEGDSMSNYPRGIMVINLTYCCDKAGDPGKALATYQEQIFSTPALLIYPLYYERLFELQVKAGHQDEALTTASMGYALCEFEQTAIEAMSNLVKKAYASRGEIFKATQFFAAQEDPEKPNPLRDVLMPIVTDEQLARMLEACGDDGRLKVCSYLYAGGYKQAMIAAQDAMAAAAAAEMPRALREVARVLKAKSLNLIRGNQFLDYAKTGEGENPLAGFWEEAE